MKVIDHEPHWWFLLEEEGALLLDVNCSHSFFSYNFMMQLDADERGRYAREGRSYLGKLADDIQNSAPMLKDSFSRFKQRDVSPLYSDQVMQAITAWRASA